MRTPLQVDLDPQSENFVLGIPTCSYLKTLVDPTRPPVYLTQPPVYPTRPPSLPNTSQWNIVRVGYLRVGFALFALSVEYGLQQNLNTRPPAMKHPASRCFSQILLIRDFLMATGLSCLGLEDLCVALSTGSHMSLACPSD